jgi:SAM-dependent methyltransferase
VDRYQESNQRLWDKWTTIHEGSEFYSLEAFKDGTTVGRPYDAAPGVRVRDYEVEELGDVAGKDLLHLQCHFGIDTLSWARLGATVTGADFSANAITLARSVAEELKIAATFVQSTIEDLPSALDGSFDVVYTSRGAIWWLADLRRWAEVVVHFLRPGGAFYMTEFHPALMTLDESTELRLKYPYFHRDGPGEFESRRSYADLSIEFDPIPEYGWFHDLGEIVTSLASAGLRIELLHELDWCDYQHIPLLVEGEDGKWRLPPSVEGELPLMYSIRARKS